jgi:Fe-S-cluster-containing dehydrogenase component
MDDTKPSRRKFLTMGLAAGAMSAVGASFLQTLGKQDEKAKEEVMAKYAIIIDANLCIGCNACAEACNIKNELPKGKSYIRRLVRGDEHVQWFLTVQCQHCANPPCAKVCPTDATYRREEDGVVLLNPKLCVGCKYCIYACPYDARIFEEDRGVVDKCWLCLDFVLAGGLPACVQACPVPGARFFGRQDDPDSEVSRLIRVGLAKPLHPEFGTNPSSIFYIPKFYVPTGEVRRL